MRADVLRAELARLARARAADRATCPDPDRLLAAADLSLDPPARSATMLHVTRCAACRAEFDMLRTLVVSRQELEKPGTRRWMIPLAAAAVALLSIGLTIWLRTPATDAVRGTSSSRIAVVAPHGDITGVFDRRLIWRPAAPNASYSVTLMRDGLPVFVVTAILDTVVALPDSIHLTPSARYEWFVESIDGATRSRSPVTSFTLRAP